MNETDTTNTNQPKRRVLLWGGLIAIVAGIATVGAIAHTASEHFGPFAMMHGEVNVEQASKHIKKMVNWTLEDVDATADQKAKVNDILQAAMKDLLPEHQEINDAHAQVIQLMSQPTIDRAALEAIRASQIARFDAVSKRLTQAIEDAGDVLTPEQRQKLIAMHHGQHMTMHHMGN
jgi:protein CpxP